MRLLDQEPVGEVAKKLGLSREQVWYRLHRAKRELQGIGSALTIGRRVRCNGCDSHGDKNGKIDKSAQGNGVSSVSQNGSSFLARHGGNCVDVVCQRLELGPAELMPEWKVEWNFHDRPRPVLYFQAEFQKQLRGKGSRAVGRQYLGHLVNARTEWTAICVQRLIPQSFADQDSSYSN